MRTILRGGGAVIAVLLAVPLAIVAIVAQFPGRHFATTFTHAFVAVFGTHFLLAGLVAVAWAFLAYGLGARRAGQIAIPLALLAVVLYGYPIASSWQAAREKGYTISVLESLRYEENLGAPDETRSVTFATVAGQDLKLDVWLPAGQPAAPRPAIVWVHGGGWEGGTRGSSPRWNAWLTERGYAVFDIDYRLTPPPRWDQATGDVKCAIGWVKANAATYAVDPRRIMVAGNSAGGNLALLAAYTAEGTDHLPSCQASDTTVAAVVALAPITDVAAWWQSDATWARHYCEQYTGGTPTQFPERYTAISPLRQVRPGLPPTLLMHGAQDGGVSVDQSLALAAALATVNVPQTLVTLPYADHGYERYWHSFSTQVTRQAFAAFLDRHLPVAGTPDE